jgi:hypothetical protein
MIFSGGNSRTNLRNDDFKPFIGSAAITIVESYKYLDIMLSSNGSFKLANCHLDKKAKKALFGMHSYINDCTLPPNTCVQLFDKLIQPVSSYGSEV